MNEVWIVQHNIAYEGFSIEGIFSTKEKAIAFAKNYGKIPYNSRISEDRWSLHEDRIFIKGIYDECVTVERFDVE